MLAKIEIDKKAEKQAALVATKREADKLKALANKYKARCRKSAIQVSRKIIFGRREHSNIILLNNNNNNLICTALKL